MSDQQLGTCADCRRTFGKSAMSRHLAACAKRPGGSDPMLHVAVESRFHPDHWMQLELQPQATFRALDAFFRQAWLECCGHMSEFRLGERKIGASSTIKLAQLLKPKDKLRYDYDFGSTTTLLLRAIATRPGTVSRHPIRLLALNEPVVYPCRDCGAPGRWISCWTNNILCDAHRPAKGDQAECLPLVNSPRAGVCGYDGPAITLPPLAGS